MTIETIKQLDYNILLEIQSKYPVLTLQNKGYEGLDRDKFNDEERQADKFINKLLSKHVVGFSRFQNFKLNQDGNITLRLQYDYSADSRHEPGYRPCFIGVGYITLEQLLNGF